MTGKDFRYKPGVVKKAKFQYTPWGKVFNKRLDKSYKKEELLERLKNIEGKDEEQLKGIKDQGEKQFQILTSKTDKKVDFKNVSFKGKLDSELKKIYNDIKEQIKRTYYTKLVCIGYFGFQGLIDMQRELYKTKNTDKNKLS